MSEEEGREKKASLRRELRMRASYPVVSGETYWKNFEAMVMEGETLVGYVPMKDELDVTVIMENWLGKGGRLLLPAFDKQGGTYRLAEVKGLDEHWLIRGKYGILEPLPELDSEEPPYIFDSHTIWLVPGMAFCPTGARLGRGRGYYDRLLSGTHGIKIGVLHSSRLLESIPMTAYDIYMDYLLTETGLFNRVVH